MKHPAMLCARIACVLVFLTSVAGCAVMPPGSRPIDAIDPAAGYRFRTTKPVDNSNSLMIVATFSGGGMRAAALAYAVLEELAQVEIKGRRTRLIDELDAISAVSGGSATAAYYALVGDQIFEDFARRFLSQNLQSDLVGRILSPTNWPRLTSSSFGRSDLVAEVLDDHLLGKATFGDLVQRGRRPFVTINATDMATGHRFEFIQEQFDLMCSDMNTVPLSRAVAASAAVPLALSPITIQNNSSLSGAHKATVASRHRMAPSDGLRDRLAHAVTPERASVVRHLQ